MFLKFSRLYCLLLVLFLLIGCTSSYSKHEFQELKMGTLVSVTIYEKKSTSFKKIKKSVDEIFLLIEKYQKEIFDVNNPNSEISIINKKLASKGKNRGNKDLSVYNNTVDSYTEFKVSDPLYEVFEISVDVAKKTNFAFDIGFKSVETLWFKSLKNSKIPNKKELYEVKKYTGSELIKLKGSNRVLIKSGANIALGGIAKGYIMDKAFDALRSEGLNNFIINAGGDLKLSGSKGGKPWISSVLVAPETKSTKLSDLSKNSNNQNYYAYCTTKDQDIGIATSASYYRFTEHNGKRYSHIIDTRTLRPSESDIVSITVLHTDMSFCDAYATAFYIQAYKELTDSFDNLDRENIGVIVINNKKEKKMNKTAARYCRFVQ
jgi:FAD:protein FMN transferase